MKYSFIPSNYVCPEKIEFELEGNIVKNIVFTKGCPGNTLALSKLLEGQSVEYIVEKLKGNLCGNKNTSCADQLAIAILNAYKGNQ